MTLPRRTRRLLDAAVAAVIALAVVAVAAALWAGSDARATTLIVTPEHLVPEPPEPATAVPSALVERWRVGTDPRYGALATPYGTVVTTDQHTVRGFDAATGATLWQYGRENLSLCAIGSGDTTAADLAAWTGIHGVMTLFAKNGYCSQVTLLDPATGERLYQRTSPGSDPGALFFGPPYVGWLGADYLELWRHDLVVTIRYGNQPNPVNASGPHTGCTFSDAAVTKEQLATIEHCDGVTNLVLTWPTPGDAPGDKGWDTNHSQPKATVPLAGDAAVIVGITADRVAVLVADPSPAIVVYDSAGVETSRTPVDITGAEITRTAAAGLTPSIMYDDVRYTLVGSHLIAMSERQISVPAPVDETADGETTDSANTSASPTMEPATVAVDDPVLDWVAAGALGLPADIDGSILIPVAAGLQVWVDGAAGDTIPVQRDGYSDRVDVTAVGEVLIEVRGDTVVALGE